jgi:hypothetical protein
MLEFNTATGTVLTMMTDNVVTASTILLAMSAGLIVPKCFSTALSACCSRREAAGDYWRDINRILMLARAL